jgi:hypothetical protein
MMQKIMECLVFLVVCVLPCHAYAVGQSDIYVAGVIEYDSVSTAYGSGHQFAKKVGVPYIKVDLMDSDDEPINSCHVYVK